MKRIFDIVVSGLALLLLWPLLLVVALIVRIDSPGPALFRQVRVGRGGSEFKILKFRTMHTSSDGSLVTADGDSRVTGAGEVLRKTKIDEIPQLLNVLKGDMSLVGPRPEVPPVRIRVP